MTKSTTTVMLAVATSACRQSLSDEHSVNSWFAAATAAAAAVVVFAAARHCQDVVTRRQRYCQLMQLCANCKRCLIESIHLFPFRSSSVNYSTFLIPV